jgi:hypothetical protein
MPFHFCSLFPCKPLVSFEPFTPSLSADSGAPIFNYVSLIQLPLVFVWVFTFHAFRFFGTFRGAFPQSVEILSPYFKRLSYQKVSHHMIVCGRPFNVRNRSNVDDTEKWRSLGQPISVEHAQQLFESHWHRHRRFRAGISIMRMICAENWRRWIDCTKPSRSLPRDGSLACQSSRETRQVKESHLTDLYSISETWPL